jgi:multidrug efflux pump subunit AcrA (membrane-fusion protein)
MRPRRLTTRLAEQRGEASILSGLLLLVGVLIPLMFLIPLFARVELAQVDVQQTARDAARSAVQAPDQQQAEAAAQEALARERAGSGQPLSLSLTGAYARGATMTAKVSTTVPIGDLPFLGDFGTIAIHADASAPVDRYRSILAEREGSP